MVLNIICPRCGALLDVTPEWLGQPIECGGCASVFVCPELAEDAPPDDGPKVLREKQKRRHRDRDDGDWDDYRADSPDDDPDSHLAKKRGPGYATASMVLGILALTLAMPVTIFTCGFGGFVQITVGIVGLILGYIGLRSDARVTAIAGMVMNVLAALFAVLYTLMWGGIFSMGPFRAPPPPPPPATVATWKTSTPLPAKAKR